MTAAGAPVPPHAPRGLRRALRTLLRLVVALALAELALMLVRPAPLEALRTRTFHVESSDADFITLQPLNFDPRTGEPLLVWDPELFWRMAPGRRGTWFMTEGVRTNALGLRGPELPAAREAGELRLLALGDSITFGFRVAEPERWTERLADALAQQRPGRRVVPVNAGVVGYASSQGRAALPALLEAVRPDVVVACFGVNDCIALDASDRTYAALVGSEPERLRQAARRSRLVCALEAGWAWLRRALEETRSGRRLPVVRWVHYPAVPPTREKVPRSSEPEYLDNLSAMHAACRDAGVPLVVVTARVSAAVPSERSPDPALFERIEHRFDALAAWAAEHDVPLADARAALARSGLPDGDLLLDPFHPTPAGHALMAEEIAGTLHAAGLADARR